MGMITHASLQCRDPKPGLLTAELGPLSTGLRECARSPAVPGQEERDWPEKQKEEKGEEKH
eukprot:127852-Pyramimonas_sp.AAC.1